MSERKKRQRQSGMGKITKMIILILLIWAIAFAALQVYNMYRINADYKKVLIENTKLKKERESLKEELKHVNEPEYIEQQAREQLKMVKPGEVMYILPQNETKDEKQGE
ncbi:MAG: septum formation initiator family protein [Clostridiales bacterium]|jgi:cell division protein ftsL|nr:septum formation initiator family protein [Clostridiales bacterium]